MLYELAIVQVPTVIEQQNGGQEKLIVPLTQVMANNPNTACVLLGAKIADMDPQPDLSKADNLVIKIRGL